MIDKTSDMTSLDESQLPILNSILDGIRIKALSVKVTSTLPTTGTVAEGQLVIYDNDAGTKRLYVVTGKKNLGYVNLT